MSLDQHTPLIRQFRRATQTLSNPLFQKGFGSVFLPAVGDYTATTFLKAYAALTAFTRIYLIVVLQSQRNELAGSLEG